MRGGAAEGLGMIDTFENVVQTIQVYAQVRRIVDAPPDEWATWIDALETEGLLKEHLLVAVMLLRGEVTDA